MQESKEQEITSLLQGIVEPLLTDFLNNDKSAILEAEFLGLDTTKSRWGLRIATRGFELNQKLKLEQLLLHRIIENPNVALFTELNGLGIFFQSLKNSVSQTVQLGPTPIENLNTNISHKKRPQGVKNVFLVASGKGGVGKSTVSVNLAIALSKQGLKVGLVDADLYGPSAAQLLGTNGPMQVDTEGRLIPRPAHGLATVSFSFLADPSQPTAWRGPLISKAIEQLFFDVSWQDVDVLVVDMPPGTGDIQLTILEQVQIDGVFVVTTPEEVAVVDAIKAIRQFEKAKLPIFGLIENKAYYICPCCGKRDEIFGQSGIQKLQKEVDVPLLVQIPISKDIITGSDQGIPIATKVDHIVTKSFTEVAEIVSSRLVF
ncbi:MAG: Mrp/NBP35 family ATP-binding protein [Oligoflexales bacterium]|nr:Mrp/NBP35 family ATP-binding protein [Oligoflexales bacterium]